MQIYSRWTEGEDLSHYRYYFYLYHFIFFFYKLRIMME